VDEVVVQRRGGRRIGRLRDLSGLPVWVRRSSSYYESIADENRKLRAAGLAPIRVRLIDDALPTERILSLVASGAVERTVADSMIAEAVAAGHPELEVLTSIRLRENGELAWAVPLGAEKLLAEVNRFLPRYAEGSLHGNMAVEAYFGSLQPIQRQLAAGESTPLSPYDDIFREFASRYGIDWRLFAAVAWQESRFDQSAQNRSGATGVFQIKPQTAAEPYIGIPNVKGPKNARNNIHAGIKYLAWIKARYFDPVSEMEERDRLRMALAAYNAGPRTVQRARKKAAAMGLDPNRWFRNVELAMLAMRKREPVRYVSQINQSYVAYMLLGYE
jgi:membrane-bound lytic murein transglycosylase MltF